MYNRVLLLRTHRRLCQKAVATELGISQAMYSKLERNWQNSRLETFQRLAKVLRVPVRYFTDEEMDWSYLN